MRVDEMFPGRWLHGADLKSEIAIVIDRVVPETMHNPKQGEVTNYVLYAKGGKKGIVLNKTLANQIKAAVGVDDTDAWPGKRITLFPEKITVAGEPVIALRAKAAPKPAAANQPAPAAGSQGKLPV
jgi:hypothetical protein